MKKLRNWIKNIVVQCLNEKHESLFTLWTLVEKGETLIQIELHVKPAPGDVIVIDDFNATNICCRFKVQDIEYSQTGFTGKINGYSFDDQTTN